MKSDRIYVDTSVFGGVFDDKFKNASHEFFDECKGGHFCIVTSAIVQEEITFAPHTVRAFFDTLVPFSEVIDVSIEALNLREEYIKAGILTKKYSNDALHVALATISECRIIVSWNFKHIVHFKKIPLYNAVNVLQGYNPIAIYSPLEVIEYED